MRRRRSRLPHWSRAPELRERVRAAPALALALDVDGTLAPVVPLPADAEVPDPTRAALSKLADRPDVIAAAVSGRRLAELRGLIDLPEFRLFAEHGLLVAHGERVEKDPAAAEARLALEDAARRLETCAADAAGAWVERKDVDVVLHFRATEEGAARRLVERARAAVADLVQPRGTLDLEFARKAIELRPASGPRKGDAIPRLLRERGDALPLFVGDDIGDEDGFAAAERLGGFGVWVSSDEVYDDETWAACYLRDPADVRNWLWELAEIREAR